MTAAAADFCVAFDIQQHLRDVLSAWDGLEGVDVATGPRRKELNEGVTVARPRSHVAYHGAYRAEEGTVTLVCDAFVAGTGEDTIDAARARAKAILNECIAAVSLSEQTGGDITIGSLVLATTDIDVEEADNYTEDVQARVAGHGYTIAATIAYIARIVTPGGSS